MYASDNQSVPYSIKMRITDDLQTYAESTGDSRFYTYNNQLQNPYMYIDMSNLYVRSIIEPFLKGCTINDNMQFSGYMRTYDPNNNFSTLPKYIYAQNVTVKPKKAEISLWISPSLPYPAFRCMCMLRKWMPQRLLSRRTASFSILPYCALRRYACRSRRRRIHKLG